MIEDLEQDKDWFSCGEFYSRRDINNKKTYSTPELIRKIIEVFDKLYPLYLIFRGEKPLGKSKLDKLLRSSDVTEEELNKKEIEIKKEIRYIASEEIKEKISEITKKNLSATTTPSIKNAKNYKRNATLSAMPKNISNDKCQICGETYILKNGEYFCETPPYPSIA